MTKNPIIFQRQRDLGEIITDTFKFIRENFRILGKLIFRITAPVFIILLFAIAYYSYLGLDSFNNPFFGISTGVNLDMYFISIFILVTSLLAFYILLYSTILHLIGSYIRNEGRINENEVYSGVKSDFGSMLGLFLLIGLMTGAGLLLCILPGVYLWVPLSLTPAILVMGRGDSVIDTISNSFTLVKDNWWVTFLSLFVITLLVYIIGLVFQLPLIFYVFIKALMGSQEVSVADPASFVDWVYIVFNVIASLAQYLLTSILVVASAFIYFDLDEKKYSTGSFKTISNLGASEKDQ